MRPEAGRGLIPYIVEMVEFAIEFDMRIHP